MNFRMTGTASFGTGVIKDENISNNSGDEISPTKLTHVHKAGTNFNLAIGGTLAAREEIVYTCEAANATVRGFHALLNDTGTTTDVNFDLKKNGTTMLSGTVNITNAASDRAVSDGSLSSTELVAGDVLSISLAVTSSTGAQGPFAWVEVSEVAG